MNADTIDAPTRRSEPETRRRPPDRWRNHWRANVDGTLMQDGAPVLRVRAGQTFRNAPVYPSKDLAETDAARMIARFSDPTRIAYLGAEKEA